MTNIRTGPPAPDETTVRRTTETTTYSHNRAWLPWLACLLLVPLALALLYFFPFGGRDKIQDDLAAKARETLAAAQIPVGAISFNGKDATLCGIPDGMVDQARAAVAGVNGVAAVQTNIASCGPVGGPGTTAGPVILSVQSGRLSVEGNVADEATKSALVQGAAAAGLPVDDRLSVQAGAPLQLSGTDFGNLAETLNSVPGDRSLTIDGSTATLTGTVATEQEKQNLGQQVQQLAPSLTVVNDLSISAVPSVSAMVQNGRLVLSGTVPDEAAMAAVNDAAVSAGLPVDNQLTIDPTGTLPTSATDIGRLVGVLADAPGDHGLKLADGTLVLTGEASSQQAKDTLEQQLKAIAPTLAIDNQMTVAAANLTPDKAALQQQIAGLIQQAPITFEPDSATLTSQGTGTAQQIGTLLAAAPDVTVEVAGHVADATSPADGQLLSEQRAAAVKDMLVSQGVVETAITTVGFGDTKPIADNNTPEGQALNRRVEITIR